MINKLITREQRKPELQLSHEQQNIKVENHKASLLAWFDSSANLGSDNSRFSWLRISPFIAIHLSVLLVFWVGFSWIALAACALLYFIRMFAITAFYHRYFSHKSFKTSRFFQFVFAFIGAMSAQRGPLWWASHHRVHHACSDSPEDPHSPKHKGSLWSHMLWFLTNENFATREEKISDFSRYPELRWLDRFEIVAPAFLILMLFLTGEYLANSYQGSSTSGLQMVVWGFCISTVILYHATYTINSLAHRFGKRRFQTKDDSRNNFWLALLTLGEGWHNNHHYYATCARQGFAWYEIDISYYILKLLAVFGIVTDLKPVPARIKKQIRGEF
ncbi:acyl-CoA desaturase [Aliikangiella sp. G2MR2-5]|uniref:acyl-CoA desaturase n=1 Tax=Aliikangiella sp. G2MR2-5 TaxID=2788943 RepID=UPI0018A89E98|nr:acyl-CoA desaturase [Aliikangiella sp. G2MR2-5]